jgi:hypothetical protein
MGGDSTPDNLMLCCHECNIIKSTMDSNAFIQLLGVLNKEENRRVKQIWQGKIANKIDRVNYIYFMLLI